MELTDAKLEILRAKTYVEYVMNDLSNVKTVDRSLEDLCNDAKRKCQIISTSLSSLEKYIQKEEHEKR